MNLVLSPKDNLGKVILNNVETFALEGETLLVVFEDGTTRNYPLMHLWYYSSRVSDHEVILVNKEEVGSDHVRVEAHPNAHPSELIEAWKEKERDMSQHTPPTQESEDE